MSYTYAHDFDSSVHRSGYIPGTEYTLPYLSRFSIAHDDEADLLRHVNCSLLSTPGVPPTLLALKQHAQSLAYLISMLQPHGGDNDAVEVLVKRAEAKKANKRRKTGPTNGDNTTNGSLLRELVSNTDDTMTDNPFDWLDLSRAYTNDTDPSHHRPLLDLVNEVQSRHDAADETTYHCPLTTYKPRNGGRFARGPNADAKVNTDGDEREWDAENFDKVRPYASYHGLLMHVNMCLERLDHEYAATGGLLSLLPVRRVADAIDKKEDTEEEPEMVAARNTLVGQWLAFTQSLVGRTTELEVAYANAAHALRGQAAADSAGADAVKWRMIHAGDDIWQDVHNKLDTAGTADYKWAEHRNAQGVVGEQAVGNGNPQNQTEFVNYVDINTRYYRTDIYDTSPIYGPIYVCPVGAPKDLISVVDAGGRGSAAAANDANLSALANIETMRVLTATALEQRYDRRLQEAGRIARTNKRLAEQALQQAQALLVLRQDHKQMQAMHAELQRSTDEIRRRMQTAEAELQRVKSKNPPAKKRAN